MVPSPDFDPQAMAKTLLRAARSGSLATLIPGTGHPYSSLVNVASGADGTPILLISQLALHTQNISADPRVSLLLDARGDTDPLQSPRISLSGRAVPTIDPNDHQRYLACHPDAQAFAGFKDFGFYRIVISGGHLVAGFGRIVDLEAEMLLTDLTGAEPLLAAAAGAVSHMNADHADALGLYATRLLGAPDGDWTCVGCDPEGLDLQNGRTGLRLPFPQRVTEPSALRMVLKQLADRARSL